jgi:hypothetical protein
VAVSLATMRAILGYTFEANWLRHARAHLRHLFPYLPQHPGYNERLGKAAGLMRSVHRILATTPVWSDEVWVVDSTPVECGRYRETVKHSDLAGWAEYSYCESAPTDPHRRQELLRPWFRTRQTVLRSLIAYDH